MIKKQVALKELLADIESPVSTYMKLSQGSEDAVLLESVYQSADKGRFSIIGLEPIASITLYKDKLEVKRGDELTTLDPEEFFGTIRKLVTEIDVDGLPELPGIGCLTGYIGYDAVRLIEQLPNKNESSGPIAKLILPSLYAVFDHLSFKMVLVALKGSKAEAMECLANAEKKLKGPRGFESKGSKMTMNPPDKDRFMSGVVNAQEMIAKGETFQLVLSADFEGTTDAHPFDVYRNLRADSPSPYMFYLKFGENVLLGSSPETMVNLSSDRTLKINPIAGTRSRSEDKHKDEELAKELMNSQKEKAEHTMLVDLARNDAGRVCKVGTIKTDPYMSLVKYSHVMHLVSEVKGELVSDLDAVDAFQAGFPAGTVSGAPKVRAMELIDEIEDSPRGPYAGAVGYFAPDGSMDTCIAIRIAEFEGDKFKIRAGAGIVAGSTPEGEYKEINHKAAQTIGAVKKAARVH